MSRRSPIAFAAGEDQQQGLRSPPSLDATEGGLFLLGYGEVMPISLNAEFPYREIQLFGTFYEYAREG